MVLQVKEIMVTKITSLEDDRNVREAAEVMSRADVGSVLVNSEGRPVGIVTERDIVRKIVAEGVDASKILVTDVMSTPLITVSSNASIEEASELMATYKIKHLPVVDEGEVVGIVAARDIALNLAKEQNFEDVRLNAIAGIKSGELPPPYG
jgi:CBS domain-containing protein